MSSADSLYEPPKFRLPPNRVVSLVPSITESFFNLGIGDALVGITDYCVQPASEVSILKKVGGTKNPHLEDILALRPDFVIANWEENPPDIVAALQDAGVTVWVTFPKSVADALEVLRALVGIFRQPIGVMRLQVLEKSIEWARSASENQEKIAYFCPIWQKGLDAGEQPLDEEQIWWMTFNHDTYPHDLLSLMGGENIFAKRERRYPLEADLGLADPVDPGERDIRYPRVTLKEVIAATPEMILLPSEPFAFTQDHLPGIKSFLSETPAVKNEKVFLVDGSLITWHGTRVAEALQTLPEYFESR